MTDLGALLARRKPHNGSYLTVAIDGRGGSGKSALADFVATLLPDFTVVHGDDWFEPHDDPVTWGAFNEARLEGELLAPLRSGTRQLRLRRFDFEAGHLGPVWSNAVRSGVIFERWQSFGLEVRWDVTIWVETPREVCLERGLRRELGSVERVRRAWETVWQPAEDSYIAEHSPLSAANVVVGGTVPFGSQLSTHR